MPSMHVDSVLEVSVGAIETSQDFPVALRIS